MLQIAKIKRDRSFKPRLIIACLTVALLVSAIYVTVSYRLTADVSLKTELRSIDKVTQLLAKTIQQKEHDLAYRNSLTAILLAPDDNSQRAIAINGLTLKWQKQWNMDLQTYQSLLIKIEQADSNTSPLIELNGVSFLWRQINSHGYKITYIEQTTAQDITNTYIAKRLFITTVVVFWIAVWLALTLSSAIAKRARELNEALAQIATQDSLTGLPNRLYLVETLENSLSLDAENAISQGSLLVIDLDKFKEVNDSFGYAAGDLLLKDVANRLQRIISEPNEVVRTGGDEFIVWSPHATIDEATDTAKAIVLACNEPIIIHGLLINTGASVGVAHFPTHASNVEGLIVSADTAMHKAKQLRCGWKLFDVHSSADYKDTLQLRAELSDALEHQQIVLFYQPKIDLITGKIVGVEGLCRWLHPRLDTLLPAQFIDLIEHSGKVQEFGRYIIELAIRQVYTWQQQGINVPIAINLSPYNLLDPGLVEFIQINLASYNVPASLLEIELTENETCLNIHYLQNALDNIRALGVSIALDDFGTGMSSLAYLSKLNANVLKIDKLFINEMEQNAGHRAIIASAITLAQSFGCSLIAEGVETKEQAAMLKDMGCTIAQGFLFAKPMTADAIATLITTDHSFK